MTKRTLTIGLVGNPNCGKTSLFNALTGARQQVGNWPGVTVERKTGNYQDGATAVTVVDLPGVYSLGVTSLSSIDERVARDYVLANEADVIVNILDASNLERNLYLTTQLLEMQLPIVVALNMVDIARTRRMQIDVAALAEQLGCPVVALVATRGEGVNDLKAAIAKTAAQTGLPTFRLPVVSAVTQALDALTPRLAAVATERRVDPRWLALKLLEGDVGVESWVGAEFAAAADAACAEVARRADEDADILIADARYGFANQVVDATVVREGVVERTRSDWIDRIVLHRLLGLPIFFVVMYLLFLFSVNFGSAFIDFFDQFVGAILVDGFGQLLADLGSPTWLTTILADGIGGGIQTVATFIPIIACLYLFLSFLEDCGYMARAAFVMDRVMRAVGLPGKSFIPLIVGFGCNVPAIMATRTLESRRDRIITVMMAPFMSCGARLPVYALFAAAFFPTGGHNLVFALYLIGIGFAVMTGLVLKTTLLRGETAPFVMELPPYHLPTLKGLAIHTWDRLKAFTLRAGRVIVCVVALLSFFGSIGTDGSFGNKDTDQSVLAIAGKALTPVLAPMGISQDNWPATVGLLTGLLAKETVVGTLNALYGNLGVAQRSSDEGEPERFALAPALAAAFATIPENIGKLTSAITDPLGMDVVGTGNLEDAAARQDVDTATFTAMSERFDGQLGAFAYLLAVLLYMPCVSAVAAIQRETGWGWMLFACLWTTGLGYGAGVLAFQAGQITRHPETSAGWIGAIVTLFVVTLATMRYVGRRSPQFATAS
ncbi:Fe(2+) transporter permease subunit FeoB [Defluviicoccus vanus]|uniref:Ferrous iron transport protein B n=1 Tax=Defluviicoccus vanus TaxID=111831 RepID=A0A7H1N067_9PROT|nr:Fe(2+) transporter permease subunit FeoB [Defluviicoccus vanus]QNT69103.1 Fe(2+) transporter permease subunit FeoB [Defluviicoccus vanus]